MVSIGCVYTFISLFFILSLEVFKLCLKCDSLGQLVMKLEIR